MSGRQWVAVVFVLGVGVLLQIPGFGRGRGEDTVPTGDAVLGQQALEASTSLAILEVTGMT